MLNFKNVKNLSIDLLSRNYIALENLNILYPEKLNTLKIKTATLRELTVGFSKLNFEIDLLIL